EREVDNRMKKHKQLLPLVTRGVTWQGRPILIHAYKFEVDPVMKLELVVPEVQMDVPELPLRILSEVLQCHEYLLPSFIAPPRPPYERHETKFETISEYLKRTMPADSLASQCLSPVSGEGVLPLNKGV